MFFFYRSIMYEHCQGAISTPTVLIFSSISEGASSSNTTMDLQKLLHLDDSSIMSFIKIINCNGVTKAKMKVCLTNIAQKERRTINDALFESIWMTASGDIRSAIHTLQFHCYSVSTTATQQQHDKDVRLTSFHALGKILYAKRQATNNNENNNDWLNHKRLSSMPARLLMDTRPPLDFDPEKVLNENDLGPEGSIFFLSFHAVDFFEEVLELCDAMETFSDAAMFLQLPVYQVRSIYFCESRRNMTLNSFIFLSFVFVCSTFFRVGNLFTRFNISRLWPVELLPLPINTPLLDDLSHFLRQRCLKL